MRCSSGEEHYNCISALHKSIRGSDDSAAIYWLARMIEGGEDPLFIARRLVNCASEDIGLSASLSVCLSVCVFLSPVCLCLSVCLFVCVSLSVCLAVSVCVCVSVSCLSVSVCLSVYLPRCSVCVCMLSVHVFVFLSVCVYMSLSVPVSLFPVVHNYNCCLYTMYFIATCVSYCLCVCNITFVFSSECELFMSVSSAHCFKHISCAITGPRYCN